LPTPDLAGATIAFDLDGTLVDTAPDLLRVLNLVLADEGLAATTLVHMRPLIGHGARVALERAAAAQGVRFAAPQLDTLTERFVALYRKGIALESRPFPGVAEALEDLAAAGARLCVCTNKRSELSVMLLEALGLARRFRAIVGADAVPARKPHPDHLRAAIAAAGGQVERALMVGDSAADANAARAAGVPVATTRFGYSDVGVEELGADAVFEHYDALPGLARALLAGASAPSSRVTVFCGPRGLAPSARPSQRVQATSRMRSSLRREGNPFTMSLRTSVRADRIAGTKPASTSLTSTWKPFSRQYSSIFVFKRRAPSVLQKSWSICSYTPNLSDRRLIRPDTRSCAETPPRRQVPSASQMVNVCPKERAALWRRARPAAPIPPHPRPRNKAQQMEHVAACAAFATRRCNNA
jgi:phosphoglycolate phosphatase